MTKNQLLSVVGAVVLILVGWAIYRYHSPAPTLVGVTNQCASGQTCLPSLELTGPNGGVTNALQLDSGIFDNAGTLTQEGAATFSSTVGISGALTNTSTTYLSGGFRTGGTNSTSTPVSLTLKAADLATYTSVSMTPTIGAITVTLPASSTMATFLPNAGDRTSFVWVNASTTAAAVITVAAGTGTLLMTASSSGTTVAPATIDGTKAAVIQVIRKANTDLLFLMQPFL